MEKMPVLFIGHGTPMNAIEMNRFSKKWVELGSILPKPQAILMISSHWYTRGQFIRTIATNKQIYDMYGFPRAFYKVVYAPQNDVLIAKEMFEIGQKIKYLRNKGVLIIGSGNIIHNLALVDFSLGETGYIDSIAFDQGVKKYIFEKDYKKALDYNAISGKRTAFSMNDHFSPLAYVLGCVEADDEVEVFNEAYAAGSLSMTLYIFK